MGTGGRQRGSGDLIESVPSSSLTITTQPSHRPVAILMPASDTGEESKTPFELGGLEEGIEAEEALFDISESESMAPTMPTTLL